MLEFLKMFTGSTFSIFVKIGGMLASVLFGRWISNAFNKAKEAFSKKQLESNIDRANEIAGKNSVEAADALNRLEEIRKQQMDDNQRRLKEMCRPIIEMPKEIWTDTPFVVKFYNVAAGTEVFVDKLYRMAKVDANGMAVITLNTAGKRTVDIKISETDWLSVDFVINQKASA